MPVSNMTDGFRESIRQRVAEGKAYQQESKAFLAKALRERAPATAEAISEASPEQMTAYEYDAVRALALLLEKIDKGEN